MTSRPAFFTRENYATLKRPASVCDKLNALFEQRSFGCQEGIVNILGNLSRQTNIFHILRVAFVDANSNAAHLPADFHEPAAVQRAILNHLFVK